MVVDYTMSCKVGENAIQHHVVVTLDPVPALETAEFVGDVIQRLALVFNAPVTKVPDGQ